MGFTTCSLVVPSGPLKARSGGFWSGLTWAFRTTAGNSAQRVFLALWDVHSFAALAGSDGGDGDDGGTDADGRDFLRDASKLRGKWVDLRPLWSLNRILIGFVSQLQYSEFVDGKYGFLLQISWSFFLMLGKSCSLSNNWETRIQNTAQITPKFCTPSCSSVLQARVWPPVAGGTRIKSNLAEMLHNFGA